MNIQSAYSAGLSGFQNASAQINESSHRIATVAVGSEAEAASAEPVSLTAELVNMKVAEVQAKAAARVISTADEMTGTLIDVEV